MPLPKILAPLMPQSQRLQQKQTDAAVLSPALPMTPPSNNPYNNNVIGLSTEDTLVESTEELTTENAVILHEQPTSFDMCNNDLLIESGDINEQPDQKEPAAEILATADSTYQNFGNSSSSLTMSLTDSGNETLIEITPEQEIEERVMPASPPLDRTTPVTPPQLMEEEHTFVDTMEQHHYMNNPFKPAAFDQPTEVPLLDSAGDNNNDIVKYAEELFEEPQDLVTMGAEQQDHLDFTEPIQAVYTTHHSEMPDAEPQEPQEPDFMMRTNFKKTPTSRQNSLKSKCMKLIRGMKFRLSQEKKEKKKESRMKAAFSVASTDLEGFIDTNLARSVSTVTIPDEERLTPIYRRNIAKSILYNLTKTEPFAPYKSPELGSDAYDIKVLCDQSFFGRY